MSTEKGGRDTSSSSRDAAPKSTSAGATTQQLTQQPSHQSHHQQTETQPHSGIAQFQPSFSRREGDSSQHTLQETQRLLTETAPEGLSQHGPREHESPGAQQTPQTPSTETTAERPRQVIAVSASKGPAAFFNLARKFLVTDEMCDLSALEGAIVSAVDAAHLLERSQLATIVRIQTSYVTVEPKRRKQPPQTPGGVPGSGTEDRPPQVTVGGAYPAAAASPHYGVPQPSLHPGYQPLHPPPRPAGPRGPPHGGRELRRARIVITVQRTESYKQWLAENPLQAIIAGDGDDEEDDDDDEEEEHVTSTGAERRKTS